jgi:UDP-GlcNAc:undecaprenyl-phosphate GlcNAc-1-phosphate transferase
MDSAVVALVMAAALVVSAALVPPVRSLARRTGVLDSPGPRKVHLIPTPRLGGIAVFAAFTATVVGGYLALPHASAWPWIGERFGAELTLLQEAHRTAPKLAAVLSGASIAFLIGLLDDVLGTRFALLAKILGQVLAASLLVAAGVRTSFLPGEWLNAAVALLWILGITNAFNLLDNMDGLSAGVAVSASAVLLLNAWALGEFFVCLILAAFIGSLLGFLLYNFNPASIFLGDCGSLFIGYLMASLTLLERYVSHASSTLFPVLMPVVVLALPILDTATVVVIRIRERRPIYVGDSRHLSHRLVSLGFSTRTAVLFLYLATFSLGLGAASLAHATPFEALLVLLQTASFVALLLILMFFERRRRSRGPAE